MDANRVIAEAMGKLKVPGVVDRFAADDGRIFKADGTECSYFKNALGYSYASVKRLDGEWRNIGVHRLTLMAFSGELGEGLCAAHIDGDPKNNNVENLYWATPKQNADDRERHGNTPRGETYGHSKLDVAGVRYIKHALIIGTSTYSLAKAFGVSTGTISAIKTGKTWVHVQ